MVITLQEIAIEKSVLGPVDAVCDRKIRKLCAYPYPAHPKGCPNVGRCTTKFFGDVFASRVHVAALRFDFATYRAMMARKHPNWSDRQLRNPLYWQGYCRKQMRDYIKKVTPLGWHALWIPEAMGVNLTATCRKVGIKLQWPPMDYTYIIVLLVQKEAHSNQQS
jgi:hypothetical protein